MVDILLSFPVNSIQMNEENIEHLISMGLKVLPFEMDTSDKIYRILLNIGSKTPFKWQKYFSEQYLLEIEKWIKKHGVDLIQVHTPHMSKYALKLFTIYIIWLPIALVEAVYIRYKLEEVKNE